MRRVQKAKKPVAERKCPLCKRKMAPFETKCVCGTAIRCRICGAKMQLGAKKCNLCNNTSF